ncbi:hypothetical protein [Streptomyces sp. NPDC018972]|uniref:hypothetical protein n=1 Tax=Streptomyces sp. NPDC018972 TaxID=3365060 RepID=UPI0037A1A9B7
MEGVLEALRTWHTPRASATGVLLDSPLVPPGSSGPAVDLRGAITTAIDAIRTDPAGVKAHEAARTIAKAVTDRKPRTRCTFGRDAAVLTRLVRILPDRILDRVIAADLRPRYESTAST